MADIADAPETPLASAGPYLVAYDADAPGENPWQRVPVSDVLELVDEKLEPLLAALNQIMNP